MDAIFRLDGDKKPEIRLFLVDYGGAIALRGEDANGDMKTIAHFTDGHMVLKNSAYLDGLRVNSNGQILVAFDDS